MKVLESTFMLNTVNKKCLNKVLPVKKWVMIHLEKQVIMK